MASPVAAYSTLGNIQGASDIQGKETGFAMSKSIANERREEEKKRIKREKNRGIGRLFGTGTSMIASMLLAPVLGPMSVPLQMLLSGGVAAAGSAGGQLLAGGNKKIKTGMWDIDDDKKKEQLNKDSILASVGQDALSSSLLAGAKGVANAGKVVKGTTKVASKFDPYKSIYDIRSKKDPNLLTYLNYDWMKSFK